LGAEHEKGLSPVCNLWCVLSCPLCVNARLHKGKSQTYGRSP
jgi:hypothetical protein